MTVTERRGSSKTVIATEVPGLIDLKDLGLTSVFDAGPIAGFESDRLAVARTTQSVCLFRFMESLGIQTHFVSQVDPTTIRVRECQVGDHEPLSGEVFGRHCNLEILFRIRATKKFADRVNGGEVPLGSYALPVDITLEPGQELREAHVEASTKWEEVDRYVPDHNVAAKLAETSLSGLWSVYSLVKLYGREVASLFADLGFETDDGKCEVALGETDFSPIIIDVSSLDELGVRKGKVHYGKNLIREYYKNDHPIWFKKLKQAKEDHPTDKTRWPRCPLLPLDLMQQHVDQYEEVADLLLKKLG